jgi:arsenate reductase
LYGIPNCDTVKKARSWLAGHGVDVTFHDFKKQGLDQATIDAWLRGADWQTLVNRKGTTWRKLEPSAQAAVVDAASAAALMLANPSVVKRPVLVGADGVQIGFSPERYAALFGPAA